MLLRLKRYALFSAVHAVVLLIAVFGALGSAAGPVVLVASLPLVLPWGPFQADVATNPLLDRSERQRWRIAFFMVPGAMAWYWRTHVREPELR